MDNEYLAELLANLKAHNGGLVLSASGRSEAVVLSLQRYSELMGQEAPARPLHRVLVTGGAGYIGSYVAETLLAAGHTVVILDNLSTGRESNIPDQAYFYNSDIADAALVKTILQEHKIDIVCHLAGSMTGDEVEQLNNNAMATAQLLAVMSEVNVKNLIFASSSEVYGNAQGELINESADRAPATAHGFSKALAEDFIHYYHRYFGFNVALLRLFNVAGPTSLLISSILQVARGQEASIKIYGNDYETFDGTCVRDYLNVTDVSAAFVAAVERWPLPERFAIYNLGSGAGASIRQVIDAAVEVTGKMICEEIVPARSGDSPVIVADIRKARAELGFAPTPVDMRAIIQTLWRT